MEKKIPNNHGFVNKIGLKFGRLLVIDYVLTGTKGDDYEWVVKCDCGTIKQIKNRRLIKNGTQSCGCLMREIASKRQSEFNKTRLGVLNHQYNSNLTKEERDRKIKYRVSSIPGYDEWRFKVFTRDNFICLICKTKGKSSNLVSHHINAFQDFPNLITDENNGICLCNKCHTKFHRTYGYKHTTKEKFISYLNDLNLSNEAKLIENRI